MYCTAIFGLQIRRQDLTSNHIKPTNWLSDAYPVACMRWLITEFASNKNTFTEHVLDAE